VTKFDVCVSVYGFRLFVVCCFFKYVLLWYVVNVLCVIFLSFLMCDGKSFNV